MKTYMVVVPMLTAALSLPAAAAPWRDHGGMRFDVQAQRQHPGGAQRQQPQREYRQPQRDFRQPERQPERRSDGRLTDEERRNLHRDLDRANREIYKGR